MPWKECSTVDEKIKFIARYMEGEAISALCREFGISRVTGHKIIDRYKEHGLDAFKEISRRPFRQANKLPFQLESLIVNLKKEKPHWGAMKIRERLVRKYPDIRHPPACSTVHAVLDRNGLVNVRKRRNRSFDKQGTDLSDGQRPHDLWCADYKGEFMLGNKQYCYPLTITDYRSRYLIACEALETTKEEYAITVFEDIFREHGLPRAIRTDNGVPFSSPNALYGLSRLSVWWLRLGVKVERIEPGKPQQNGRHERMHLTLKQEATKPAELNFLRQQARFDAFQNEFNNERPHQGLEMKTPAQVFTKNVREYQGLPELKYPMHDLTVRITNCGRVCIGKRKINLSRCFAGHDVGVREVDDKLWLVSFMDYDLGYFDEDNGRVEPIENPFAYKV
jgi:putative transposase